MTKRSENYGHTIITPELPTPLNSQNTYYNTYMNIDYHSFFLNVPVVTTTNNEFGK